MNNLFAISNVKIIDGTGNAPIEKGYIIVEGSKIKGIGSGELSGFEGNIIDFEGKTIMPGMIDCHTHLINMDPKVSNEQIMKEPSSWKFYRAVTHVKSKLSSGVTYLRDCGSIGNFNIELRDAIKAGIVEGSDIIACGSPLTITGGHGSVNGISADGADEVRKATRGVIKAGVDQVKLMATGGVLSPGTEPGVAQFNLEELKVAVEEANRVGKKTCAHAHGTKGIKNALRAGINSIEHGMFSDDEAIEMMVKQGTYLVPTLVAPYWMTHADESIVTPSAIEKSKRGYESQCNSFQLAHKAGVKIAMGTDSGTPCNLHEGCYQELELYVEYGMTPMEAIMSATKVASELLEISDNYGTLSAGKNADFIVLYEDPLKNISAIRHVYRVYKNGNLVDLK